MHDWHSPAYVQDWIEAQRDEERKLVLRRMIHLIPRDPDAELRVLDIGAGYGAVSSLVLEAFPKARVVLHDFSQPMLDEAAKRLENYSDSASFVVADLMSPDWTAAFDGRFDAVVSSIAIHNVRFPDRIRGIYHDVFPLVAPGGAFLNFDQVASSGDLTSGAERHAQLMERRRRAYEETGRLQPLAAIASTRGRDRRPGSDMHAEPEPADLERLASHEPATLTNQLKWLREAGFAEAECFYREGRRAIIGGFRAVS
jgi:tRNA (cmo5U34)-methyltransferase